MKIRGGHLKRNIEIQAGEWDYAEVSCREGSMISVVANEVDGDDFSVFIIPSESVKTVPLVGTATEYDPEGIVWGEEKVRSIDDEYIVPIRMCNSMESIQHNHVWPGYSFRPRDERPYTSWFVLLTHCCSCCRPSVSSLR